MTSDPRPRVERIRAAAGVVLLAFVVIVGVSYSTRTQPTMSVLDGRTLEGFPAPSRSTVASGSWMAAVESWTDDRILGRQAWLSLHATIAADALRMQEINNIAIDRQSGLLLEKPGALPANPKLGEYARSLGDAARAAGAVPLFVYVPRKEEAFADLVPPLWNNTYLAQRGQVKRQLAEGGAFLDLTALLSRPSTRLSDYYLTDHHWSPTGALAGLAAIDAKLRTLGVRLGPSPEYVDQGGFPGFLGSYARRITAAGTPTPDPFVIPSSSVWAGQLCPSTGRCTDPVFPSIARSKELYANRYAAFLGGDRAIQRLENKDPRARGTIVILKDSYGLPLVTYLAQQAKTVIAIDERKYDGIELRALFLKERPDAVLIVHNIRTLLGDSTFSPRTWVDVQGGIADHAG